jgi:hypothetical protein
MLLHFHDGGKLQRSRREELPLSQRVCRQRQPSTFWPLWRRLRAPAAISQPFCAGSFLGVGTFELTVVFVLLLLQSHVLVVLRLHRAVSAFELSPAFLCQPPPPPPPLSFLSGFCLRFSSGSCGAVARTPLGHVGCALGAPMWLTGSCTDRRKDWWSSFSTVTDDSIQPTSSPSSRCSRWISGQFGLHR